MKESGMESRSSVECDGGGASHCCTCKQSPDAGAPRRHRYRLRFLQQGPDEYVICRLSSPSFISTPNTRSGLAPLPKSALAQHAADNRQLSGSARFASGQTSQRDSHLNLLLFKQRRMLRCRKSHKDKRRKGVRTDFFTSIQLINTNDSTTTSPGVQIFWLSEVTDLSGPYSVVEQI